MNIIEFKNVSKSFFSKVLYKNVDLEINSGDKIALIGDNGTGKSTFINLITGEESADKGRIIRDEESKIACFDQLVKIDGESKVQDLLNLPFKRIIDIQNEIDNISSKFTDDEEENAKLLKKYTKLSDKFESLGGYSYLHIQSEFIEIFGLGDKLNKIFREVSGGEKQYIRLAITLFSDSDLIILDEPLSFFDKKKTAWLSKYILESPKSFLVVSHNVDFIRVFANKIFDVDNMRVETYECNYQNYLKEKKIRLSEIKKKNEETEKTIGTTEEAIEKKLQLLERCNNKHAHAIIIKRMRNDLHRLKMNKIKLSEESEHDYLAPPKELYISTRVVEGPLVKLENISKEYKEKLLYKDVNLTIEKDTKICIVGENGAGKSTLLKIIAGNEEVTTGKVIINKDAKIVSIEQDISFENEKLSVKDYLKETTGLSDDFIEAGIDNLYNNDIEFRDKRIFMLSGGEKRRLEIFAKTLQDTDLLIIDEPSTYMDDYSKSTIANMLLDYPGAIILVSHDKVLLKKLNFETYDIRDKRFRKKEQIK